MSSTNSWTRDETIVAFNVYCKVPFRCVKETHPTIIKYARILGRSAGALSMKVGNIGRLDPDLRKRGITGLVHGAKLEQEIWNEFSQDPERLAYESERIIAKLQGKSIEESAHIDTTDLPQGTERQAIVKQRVNQSFFRTTVLISYNSRCCISGIGTPELLEACHISDWSEDEVNRTNPKNGLCLNSFFHKSYDNLLLAITPDFKIKISDELLSSTFDKDFKAYLACINGSPITLPYRFLPDKDLLQLHYEKYLNR